MKQDERWVLYGCFPVTIYLFVGTTLFFIFYKVEQLSERLLDYSEYPLWDDFVAVEWHNQSVWLTAFFPILGPLLAVRVLLVFLCGVVVATGRWSVDAVDYIWETIGSIFSR